MTLTFQEESFMAVQAVLAPLWPDYWAEVGVLRQQAPLAVDLERYATLEAAEALLCVTARTAEKVPVGFMLALLGTHNHAMSARCAFVESWYLHPDYRRGRTAIKLWKALTVALRERDYPHVLMGITVEHDISVLCAYLGLREVERVYYTYVGDKPHGGDFNGSRVSDCRWRNRSGRGRRRSH